MRDEYPEAQKVRKHTQCNVPRWWQNHYQDHVSPTIKSRDLCTMTVSNQLYCDGGHSEEEKCKNHRCLNPCGVLSWRRFFWDCWFYDNLLPCVLLKDDSIIRSSITAGIWFWSLSKDIAILKQTKSKHVPGPGYKGFIILKLFLSILEFCLSLQWFLPAVSLSDIWRIWCRGSKTGFSNGRS